MSTDRNYEIALAKSAGEALSDIAERHGITRGHAALLAKENAWLLEHRQGRKIAEGLATRAAIAIEEAIGIWPTDSDKAEVERRAIEILRSPRGRRLVMKEIGDWLGITGTPFKDNG